MVAVAEAGDGNAAALPYHEPTIVTILIQASCLLLLNIVNTALDRLVFCGLLGQVLIGVAWGTPGAKWLSSQVEEAVVQLGYIGLILIVYEGATLVVSTLSFLPDHLLQAVCLLHSSLSKPTWVSHLPLLLLELPCQLLSHSLYRVCSMPPLCKLLLPELPCALPV
jgi:hypothetical protein